ncbi:organic hydroperoxide resistance protein [Peribacillus sp. SCS-155]|uniref:organic hydroperoxide resistance protein n=1 Tax=Peribacillus sedimenti TaxID=3115297 RepID=UPI003905A18E
MKPLYTAAVTATGGREGRVKSEDGVLDLSLKMPKELGGPGGNATNPEQLFAAGYAACFDGALNLVIRQEGKKVEGTDVTANVTIGKDEADNGFKLAVRLDVSIHGVDKQEAEELVQKAHQVCPYSKATKGNIDVTIITI